MTATAHMRVLGLGGDRYPLEIVDLHKPDRLCVVVEPGE